MTTRNENHELEREKKQNFLVQGSILAIASIAARIIALIYRIPMTNTIGDLGNDYYAGAFDIYNMMLIVSSYNLPTAVSKLVAGEKAKGSNRRAYQLLKCAILLFLVIGTAAGVIVYFGAEYFTGTLLKTPYSVFALKVLAPLFAVVAVLGVLRGFFQGIGSMVPSALSLILEQIVSAAVSLWAAYVLYREGLMIGAILENPVECAAAYGAAGGALGVSIGTTAGLLSILVSFLFFRKSLLKKIKGETAEPKQFIWKMMVPLVKTIFPILLCSILFSLANIANQALYKSIALSQNQPSSEVHIYWGVYAGKFRLMVNIPIAVATAMAASCVPSLTESFSKHDQKEVSRKMDSALRLVFMVVLPSAVLCSVLAVPLFGIFFPGTAETTELAAKLMGIGSVTIVFYSLAVLTNSFLQGIEKMKEPVLHGLIALLVNIILLIVLMLFFQENIYAVVMANAAFSLFLCVMNFFSLRQCIRFGRLFVYAILIPGICTAIMGLVAYFSYKALSTLSIAMQASFFLSLILSVAVYYFLLVFLLKKRSLPMNKQE